MYKYKILQERYKYDPATGVLTNKRTGSVVKSSVQGMPISRACYYLGTGKIPKQSIDHINGNRNDNRIDNLRDISQRGNSQNKAKHRSGKLPGVVKQGNRFKACIYIGGKSTSFGLFDTEKEAYDAYLKACAKADCIPKSTKSIRVELNEDTHAKFKVYCITNRTSIQSAVKAMIDSAIKETPK